MDDIVAFPVDADAKFHGPSYLLRGEHSKWADANTEADILGTGIYGRFPNMKITTIPDAGHNVHVDQPGAVIQHIASALNEVDIDFEGAHGRKWDELLKKNRGAGIADD